MNRRSFFSSIAKVAIAVVTAPYVGVIVDESYVAFDTWKFPNGSSIKFMGCEIVSNKYIATNMIYFVNMRVNNPKQCAVITNIEWTEK